MKSGRSKLHKHPQCDTLYLAIPAAVAQDSTFPFKAGEKVAVQIYTNEPYPYFEESVVIIKKLKETTD